MTASYCYTEVENGLLDHVTYGNGTKTVYTYDAARRLVAIDHRNPLEETVLKLAHEYTINDLVASITETGSLGWRAAVKFRYDNRGRLIREARYDADPARDYHISYEYDQGGNRTRKIRSLGGCNRIETVYHYDYEDPVFNVSYNNRLMYYETYETCRVFEDYGHTGGCGTEELVSTTWYYYNDAGNVTHVVTEKENPAPEQPGYEATRLEYARNGRAVTYVLGETWNKSGGQIVDYEITYAREFRYDSARQRYLNRVLDPAELLATGERVALSDTWSDFDGDDIYGDFETDGQTITELRSFELGIANFAWDVGVPDATTVGYYHTDRAGTTRFITDSTGAQINSSVYTAFGERISGAQHRYGYAGAWGYEASSSDDPQDPYLDLGLLHLNPYYDPATGRSLQRNQGGIAGGLNVYGSAYASSAGSGPPESSEWPLPPGHDENWKWRPNRNPNPGPKQDPGNWRDPEGRKWRYHRDDKTHNPHWDYQEPGDKRWKKYPLNDLPPYKLSRPPWWARVLQHLPVPDPQNVRKWQRRFLIGGLALGCGAAGGLVAGGAAAGAGALAPAL